MFGLFKKEESLNISEEIDFLNTIAGTWPAQYSSIKQKKEAYNRFYKAIDVAQKTYEKNETETTLCDLIDLSRIGHNMDIDNSAQNANQGIEHCLDIYPESFRCNLIASYFYLSVGNNFAAKGEKTLKKLIQLSDSNSCEIAERGLVFAYLYQERIEEALIQGEAYLNQFGSDEEIQKILDGIKDGTLQVVNEEKA